MERNEVEWDDDKNESNQRNHDGISFDEAATVFLDSLARILPDKKNSRGEARFNILGASSWGRLMVVTYTERGTRLRIISARKPTRRERRDYEEQN